ncbi:hypothetical protein NPIL_279871 [Nephila pilipes]|uniref:Uncharacterized protein n=1 Tax=Nephila pilipes TaxID=299642 RepID=A0A8X6QWR7_NEPPI|nr:hypothetical protein NPIL_540641 [Nephila pilipes]GFU50344.1 hypothetical protein NPIL_279871 [Nephila pilipes]
MITLIKKQVDIVSHEAHNKPYPAVKKIANEETKCCIVFDASSHSPVHPSLIDTLEIGPNLLPDIIATLLSFRLSKIATWNFIASRMAWWERLIGISNNICERYSDEQF